MKSSAQNVARSAEIDRPTVYDHHRLESRRWLLRWLVTNIGYKTIAKLDSIKGLENIPAEGAALVIFNHIALIDPIVIMSSLPRNVVPFAKEEAYNDILIGFFPRMWEAIPVKRGELDRQAIRFALNVLSAGEMLLVAPEGTRNPSLQRGKEGIAYLGYRSGAPIIPVAVDGTENFPAITPPSRNQSGVTIRVGSAFRYKGSGPRPPLSQLELMTEEAMYQLAKLLPEERRGVYSETGKATTDTIDFV
jgi:1-acyl-sn-glycerol-3-phosphate acyltransferase